MRILVTGSRQFQEQQLLYFELDAAYKAWRDLGLDEEFVVIEGGAPGADTLAGQWAADRRNLSYPPTLEVYPANWARYGNRAGRVRNHEMVVLGADLVLAFFQPGAGNVGTRHCVQEARTWLEFKGTIIKEVWAQ